ncbi:helix-turn-helix domain-containing protein [Levilactobacillus humaensis]|uniref:helix-turn-helix domain-containing protein n=1 Tax=Levilactobacillus humaensis TaxID=2950375 RepID=UPI0021C3F500|nr:helix-turn-helix transcriptional regulator [Levilactobacillus humaensis]
MENEFSQQLVKIRRRQNLSQEQLASQLFVSRQSISKWEQGETSPDIGTLVKLANLLQVDLNELVSGDSTGERVRDPEVLRQKTSTENFWEFLSNNWWTVIPILGIVWLMLSSFN